MAINFPSSPNNGATYTYQGIKYTYKDTGSGSGYWYLKDLGTATEATTLDVNNGTITNKFVSPSSLDGSKFDTGITNNAAAITALQNGKADTSGTYSGLRAQATTAGDVGLGNVWNYGRTSSEDTNDVLKYVTSNVTYKINSKLPSVASYSGIGQLAILAYVDTVGGAGASYVYQGSVYSGSWLTASGFRNNHNAGSATGSVGIRSDTGYRMSGSWRCLGYARSNGDYYTAPATLFVRIS